MEEKYQFNLKAILGAFIVVVFILVCSFGVLTTGILQLSLRTQINPVITETVAANSATATPIVLRPATSTESDTLTETSESGLSGALGIPAIQITATPSLSAAQENLITLQNAVIPINDPADLAQRLDGKTITVTTLEPAIVPLSPGNRQTFWVIDTDNNETFQVEAVLSLVSEHVYFWVESGLEYNPGHLNSLVEAFDRQIYPTTRAALGSEWSPGIDGDTHLYILYTSGLGERVAGLFSPRDEYPSLVVENSNAHEMFLLNADNVRLDETFAYSVLAHEFQHMIHWYQDRDEQSWLNEGFSGLAMYLNDYTTGGVERVYADDPDIQLNDWPGDEGNSLPHYGASYLFVNYLWGRLGVEKIKELVAHPTNGLDSIDDLLTSSGIINPATGVPLTADDLFADWTVASYLQESAINGGRFAYLDHPSAPKPALTETINSCPEMEYTRDVAQYGADYIRINCSGEHLIEFEGSIEVDLLPTNPYSGSYVYWSNRGDEADTTLTRMFDLRGHNGPLTLSYWTWYDLEKNFDYAYLLASLDGETWQILTTPSGTAEDPTGNSYGWAYNGPSMTFGSEDRPDWIKEQVDISQFAGQQVYLRFETITDAAVQGEGFLLDDIAIPEIGYFSDFETDQGGWSGDGFVRVQNRLPQTFRLSLIEMSSTPQVKQYSLSGDNTLQIPIEIGGEVDEVILVISGTTRFTRQRAAYRYSIMLAEQ